MKKSVLVVLFISFLWSCSNLPEEKSIASTENKKGTNQSLVSRANQFYKSKMYLEAKLCYDTLINIDSIQGLYYFRRAFSKEMLVYEDSSIETDYFKAIKYNYYKKQSAYLNLGIRHRFIAVFRCFTDKEKIAEYDRSLFFYNECLKIDPNNEKALKEQEQVHSEIRLIK